MAETSPIEFILTVLGFFTIWGVIALFRSQHQKKPFWETFMRHLGLHFWFKHIPMQIGLTALPSLVMVFLLGQWTVLEFENLFKAIIFYLMWIYFGIPLINIILYPLSKGKFRKYVIYSNTVWFALLIVTVMVAVGYGGAVVG